MPKDPPANLILGYTRAERADLEKRIIALRPDLTAETVEDALQQAAQFALEELLKQSERDAAARAAARAINEQRQAIEAAQAAATTRTLVNPLAPSPEPAAPPDIP